ncbi:hypothetical protein ABW20_dc0103934 [Dactylellina cionopaga]|nr:hypothetical protein ABW20_dc0103934 [Dactylellina cionopaga]
MASFKRFLLPILALLLSLITIAAIVVVSLHSLNLTRYGAYSSRARVLYGTVCTIIASTVASFITSQVRRTWVCIADAEVRLCQTQDKLKHLGGKWRTILGVGSVHEMISNYHVSLSYLVISLITASIVASFTPTLTSRAVKDYNVVVSSGQTYPRSEYCANVFPSTSPPGGTYHWDLPDGQELWVNAPGGTCPSRRILPLLGGINPVTPQSYAYTDSGVSIHPSAIGALVAVYAWTAGFGQNLANLIRKYETKNIIQTNQCVPVMTKNPISCSVGGTISLGVNSLTARSENGSCPVTTPFVGADPAKDNTMTKGLCTFGNVGQAIIVLGATNEYAGWLALSVGDKETYDRSTEPDLRYVVTCNVDTRDVYEIRNVTLSLDSRSEISLGWRLSASTTNNCASGRNNVNNDLTGLYAVTATSSWRVLIEDYGIDGWFDSIHALSFDKTDIRAPKLRTSFAFSNSRNALEDVLGLTAALAGAYINSSIVSLPASASVTSTRIGAGHAWAVAYAIPPLLAAVVLTLLIWRMAMLPDVNISMLEFDKLAEGHRTL